MNEWIQKIYQLSNSWFENGLISTLIGFVVLFGLAVVLNRVVSHVLDRLVAAEKMDAIKAVFLKRVCKVVLIALAGVLAAMQIKPLQGMARTMLGSSAIFAAAIGLAAQEAMANVVAGVFISLFHPFSIGDYILVQGQNVDGIVEDISLRHTVIRTFENMRVIVPNSTINNAVLKNANYEEEKTCTFLTIGISYDSDIALAKRIMAEEICAHPGHLDNRTEEEKAAGVPEAVVRVDDLGDSAIVLKAGVWTKDRGSSFNVLSDLRQSIKERYDREGVGIPFPCRTVYFAPQVEDIPKE